MRVTIELKGLFRDHKITRDELVILRVLNAGGEWNDESQSIPRHSQHSIHCTGTLQLANTTNQSIKLLE